MEKKKLKTYRVKLVEKPEFYANSLVQDPAIEVGFVAFNSVKPVMFSSDEKRNVTGPIMVADKPILRYDGSEYYNVIFSKEDIADAMHIFGKNDQLSNTTLHHEDKASNGDIYLIEQWQIENENDKAYNLFSKEEVPVGSLMRTYHIVSDDIWNKVKTGEFQGFSVEIVYDLMTDVEQEEAEAIDYLFSLPEDVIKSILDEEIDQ